MHKQKKYLLVKRILDITFAVMVIAVSWPLMLVTAFLIKLDTPGQALFKHSRVGINHRNGVRTKNNGVGRRKGGEPGPASLNRVERRKHKDSDRRKENVAGRLFTLYKFRTMYADARERFPELYDYRYSDEQLYSLPMKVLLAEPGSNGKGKYKRLGDDPRLTPMGMWLRRTSLDELPNLINVITGDMSLVGPRPDIPDNICNYKLIHMEKFNVKPGVTGLAQVMGRGLLSFHRTNELDVEYVKNCSLWLDIKIIFKTVLVALKGEGAY